MQPIVLLRLRASAVVEVDIYPKDYGYTALFENILCILVRGHKKVMEIIISETCSSTCFYFGIHNTIASY